MNKLILLLIALVLPGCTIHVHEYSGAEYGYSAPQRVRGYGGGGYVPPCRQNYGWRARGGVNLNPEVNRRRGW